MSNTVNFNRYNNHIIIMHYDIISYNLELISYNHGLHINYYLLAYKINIVYRLNRNIGI